MKNNSLIPFIHYATLVLEDIRILIKDDNSKADFDDLEQEIIHAVKYDTFFRMFTDSDEERYALDDEYYTTLLQLLGIDVKSDYANTKLTKAHYNILSKYIDNIMDY